MTPAVEAKCQFTGLIVILAPFTSTGARCEWISADSASGLGRPSPTTGAHVRPRGCVGAG